MSGFKFGGIHINDLNGINKSGRFIGCRNISDSLLPEQKEILLDFDSMDGEIDMSAANISGRVMYKTRTFEREIFIKSSSMQNVRNIAHQIATFLSGGYKELIFDENPTIKWTAKVANQIDLENVLSSSGRANIIFKAQPLGISVNNVLTYTTSGSTFTATINNKGYYSKPVITITGSLSACSVTCNSKKFLSCIWQCSTLIFDCEKMNVTADGSSAVNKLTGDFFELSPGENTLNFAVTAVGNVTIKIEYKTMVL